MLELPQEVENLASLQPVSFEVDLVHVPKTEGPELRGRPTQRNVFSVQDLEL